MSNSKSIILDHIKKALNDVPGTQKASSDPEISGYHEESDYSYRQKIDLFAERVGDYKARVKIIGRGDLAASISTSCVREQVKKLVVPSGIPKQWLPDAVTIMNDEPDCLSNTELDASDGVLTTCALAIAETGTIVLNSGPGQGRRALTLLPDYHLCVVMADLIVGIVPEAFRKLDNTVKNSQMPITLISGPSATSDIELNRVEGVHGPRRLEVFIVVENDRDALT